MSGELFKKAIEFINENKRRKAWFRVGSVLAAVVVFVTTYALILPAITMENKTVCGFEEHVHMYDCYDHIIEGQTKKMLCCGDLHEHDENCYNDDDELICGYADYVFHEHNESCYFKDDLVCTLKEHKKHEHTDECYEIKTVLVCELEESGEPQDENITGESTDEATAQDADKTTSHVHTSDCYKEEKTLICTEQDDVHEHTKDCYNDDDELICGLTEIAEHEHDETCFEEVEGVERTVLICTKPEHTHNDACYSKDEESTEETEEDISNTDESTSESNANGDDDLETEVDVTGESDTTDTTDATDTDETTDTTDVTDTGETTDTTDVTDTGETTDTTDITDTDETTETTDVTDTDKTTDTTDVTDTDETTETTDVTDTDETTDAEVKYPEEDNQDNEYSKEFAYEDKEISMDITVESKEELPEDTELQVSDVSSKSKLYKKFSSFLKDNETSDSDTLIAKNIALQSDGETLDASDYIMTAKVTVKNAIISPIKKELEKLSDAAPEALIGVMINPLSQDGDDISEEEGVVLTSEDSDPTVTLALNDGLLVLSAKATANPNYSVQYYAYLPTLASSGDATLKVIDTSGRKLPQNNSSVTIKNIYLKKTGSKTSQNNGDKTDIYKVATNSTLTEIYTNENYEYIKAPNPSYVNKLIDNSSYTLKAIWVLKSGKSATSTNQSDWNVYGTDIHFTNREDVAASDIIYISDDSVIRFIYDCATTSFTTPTTIYDYDITNGIKNSAGRWETGIVGINSEANYSTSTNGQTTWRSYRDTLAFGNVNTGTGMAGYKFDNGTLNQFNRVNYNIDNNTFGCTFTLAKELKNGKIVYNDWLCVPKLFNDGTAKGKRTYENSTMTFEKVGDTYTISSVTLNDNGTSRTLNNLQEFFNPSPYSGKVHTTIYTNNFWPVDKVTNKSDPLFGAYGTSTTWAGFDNSSTDGSFPSATGTFPVSDDGNAHNSYFGMQYAISFTLTPDYTGPLEYLFYGDDDMWVFLDEMLVCDIGGVHSSVGEYVNLWDYIGHEKGDGETHYHTLTLFYTERGASGSTCFMNFTLPSVTGINIDQKATSLRVEKEVVGESNSTQEFAFDIRIFDSSGTEIKDDYAYTKYDSEGNKLDSDLVLHDGSSFTLKNGEYIIIDYLPFGTRYTISEIDTGGYTVTSKINEVVSSGSEAKGTIIKDVLNRVTFTNTIEKVDLTLQKLDVSGTPLTGAVFELTDSDGNVVNFVENSSGSYTVPTETTQLFDTDQEYYIALNMNDEYVAAADMSDTTHYNVQLQKKTGGNNQRYKLYIQPDGSVSFQNVATGRWLDHANGYTTNQTNVLHWTNDNVPTSSDIQKWYIILNSDGSLKIKPRRAVLNKSEVVLDLDSAKVVEGQNIFLYEDNGSNAQKWKLVPVNPKKATATTTELEVGSDGVLTLSGLYPGTYTLTETTAPYDYQKLDDPIKIKVAKDGSVSVVEGNELVSVDDESGLILKVKNISSAKELTLEKYVVGSDTDESFSFDVSYTVDGGEAVKKSLTLKNGESTVLTIPDGAQVTVSESQNKDFAVTYKSTMPLEVNGNICTFTISDNTTITAVNTAAGVVIPATGGSGTYMYTIAGAAIALAALALMYKSKKSGKEKFGIL